MMEIDEKGFEYPLENNFLKSNQIDSIRVYFLYFLPLVFKKILCSVNCL